MVILRGSYTLLTRSWTRLLKYTSQIIRGCTRASLQAVAPIQIFHTAKPVEVRRGTRELLLPVKELVVCTAPEGRMANLFAYSLITRLVRIHLLRKLQDCDSVAKRAEFDKSIESH